MKTSRSPTFPAFRWRPDSLAARLWALSISGSTVLLLFAAFAAWSFQTQTLGARMATTRNFLREAAAIVEKYDAAARAGDMDVEFAQMLASHEIRRIRYDGSRFIYVFDGAGRVLVHPVDPGMEGHDIVGQGPPEQRAAHAAVLAAGFDRPERGEEFIDARDGTPQRLQVLAIPRWHWLLASSVPVGEARAASLTFALIGLAVALLMTGLSIAVTFRIVRSMKRRLRDAEGALDALARGDLTESPIETGGDEIGRIARALLRTREGLRELVREVRAGVQDMGIASEQIAAASIDLAHRTERTAGNLQSARAALHDCRARLDQSSGEVRGFSGTAGDTARTGGTMVRRVVDVMARIRESSSRIDLVVGVIDGIAFQTNILALNASVEAASAGEAGRGFSVVAQEVRNLAHRCATSAREVRGLIGASVDAVQEGSDLVVRAGDTMVEVEGAIARVHLVAGEMAELQAAQLGGFEARIEALDTMAQQNAAMVEQTSSAAESLKAQAHRLQALIDAFRLEGEA